MLFQTPAFAVFFVVLIGVLAVVRSSSARKWLLLIASYVFYMWWGSVWVVPLLATTTIDFLVASAIESSDSTRRRRLLLGCSLTANLGLLGFFKYYGFFAENAAAIASAAGLTLSLPMLRIILPVGISFYTFHAMSYTIDVYRREIPACRSARDFALFITFFPVLVAGPILRAKTILPQLAKPLRLSIDRTIVLLFLRGLVKKVLVADNVSFFADRVLSNPGAWPSIIIWCGTIAFAVQIYCDFSGYSDMARALARVFGIDIPLNFDRPYVATDPSDFWRRWHISLSTWLRDYLYIPLGGNRHGLARTIRNLMITMLLGGLWHGASWNFVVWGGLHGLLLVVHLLWRRAGLRLPRPFAWAAFQYCVLLTWIAFRVRDSRSMLVALQKFVLFDFDFGLTHLGLPTMFFMKTMLVLLAFALAHAWSARRGDIDVRLARGPLHRAAFACVIAGVLLFLFWPLAQQPFIYFQF